VHVEYVGCEHCLIASFIDLNLYQEENAADEKAVRSISSFLVESVISRLALELNSNRLTLVDGVALTEVMHNRGINMRYLGLIASKLGADAPSYLRASCHAV
jgi:hypothetical protein